MPYQDYILLSLPWIAYCVVHSALISITVTDFLERALGDKYRFYRLFFNTFSLIALVPLLRYSNSARWKTELLFTWEGHLRIVQYGLIALAAILILTGARHYSMLQFLGIQQILQEKSGGGMTDTGEIDNRGVLGAVRHPWYVAVFILLWAKDLNLTGITINLVLSAYLAIGTLLEERKLVLEFGDKYRRYQQQVSTFIPLKWLRSTLHHSSRSQAVTSPVSTRGASGSPHKPAPDLPGVFGRSPMLARIVTLLVFGLAVSAGVHSVHVPPAVVLASAPPEAFSAERAMAHVRQIARAAHPTGSAEHQRVRAYLVAELRALGLEPRLQQTIGIASRFPVAGQVTNILARLPGTGTDGKAILMTARYDSVAVGPGAADDAAGTAALLETLRALRAGSPLRKDLIVALLDGEEDGLLGAAAFVREHPWARDVGLALCLDAGGTGGRALLYETGERNASLVRVFGRTPNATGSSAMYSGYRRMPNDSDFSELRLAGITGLNLAISERGDRYHTPLDDPAHLDPRSLQHHGEAALGVARQFGMMADPPAAEADAIFFNLPLLGFVSYSLGWALPLAVSCALIWLAALVVGRARAKLRLSEVALGALAALIALLAAAAVPFVAWTALARVHVTHGWGNPTLSGIYLLALLALATAVSLASYQLARRWGASTGLAAGGLLPWVLLTLLLAALEPAASYPLA